MAPITNETLLQPTGNRFIDSVITEAPTNSPQNGILGIDEHNQRRMYTAAKSRHLLAARMPRVIRKHYSEARKGEIRNAKATVAATRRARAAFASQMKLTYGSKIASDVGAVGSWGRRRPLNATSMAHMVQRAEVAKASNQKYNQEKISNLALREAHGFLATCMDYDEFNLHKKGEWNAFVTSNEALFTQFEQALRDRADGGKHRLSTQDIKALYREVFKPAMHILNTSDQNLAKTLATQAIENLITNANTGAAVWQRARNVYVAAANQGLIEPDQIDYCIKQTIQAMNARVKTLVDNATEAMASMEHVHAVDRGVDSLSWAAQKTANEVILNTMRDNAIRAAATSIAQNWNSTNAPESMQQYIQIYIARANRGPNYTNGQDARGWELHARWYLEAAREYVQLYAIEGCTESALAAAINKSNVEIPLRYPRLADHVKAELENTPALIAHHNQKQIATAMADGGLFFAPLVDCIDALRLNYPVTKDNWARFVPYSLAHLRQYAQMLLAEHPAMHEGRKLEQSEIREILNQVAALYQELHRICHSDQKILAALRTAKQETTADRVRQLALEAAQQM